MITKKDFLEKYNLSEEELEAADISWEDLKYIYNDFSQKIPKYTKILSNFEERYLGNISDKGIHSYRTRIKDPEHLIAKIVRRKQENLRKYKELDKYNYEKFLTDLIGIRCFILFKTDWQKFHNYIDNEIEDDEKQYIKDSLKDFDNNETHTYMAEGPKVHIREGDSRTIYENLLPPDAIKSKKIYRSVHYIIKYAGVYIEIQVRTLFEEGWGEVDHHIVYPYYEENKLFRQYTGLLNRLTGLADEMSSFFCEVKRLELEHLKNSPPSVVQNVKKEEKKSVQKVANKNFSQGSTPKDCLLYVLSE